MGLIGAKVFPVSHYCDDDPSWNRTLAILWKKNQREVYRAGHSFSYCPQEEAPAPNPKHGLLPVRPASSNAPRRLPKESSGNVALPYRAWTPESPIPWVV